MVSWWFGFLGFPCEKECCIRVPDFEFFIIFNLGPWSNPGNINPNPPSNKSRKLTWIPSWDQHKWPLRVVGVRAVYSSQPAVSGSEDFFLDAGVRICLRRSPIIWSTADYICNLTLICSISSYIISYWIKTNAYTKFCNFKNDICTTYILRYIIYMIYIYMYPTLITLGNPWCSHNDTQHKNIDLHMTRHVLQRSKFTSFPSNPQMLRFAELLLLGVSLPHQFERNHFPHPQLGVKNT